MAIIIKLNKEGLIDLTVTNFNFSLYKNDNKASINKYDFNLLSDPHNDTYNYTINPALLKENDYKIKAKILDEHKVEF